MSDTPRVIMVADSDPHVRALVGRFIIESGFTVTFAVDGYDALDSARQSPPDVILADILLPRLDGLALCRLLKGDPDTQNIITVIVFSVLSAEGRAREAGADGFIRKPLEKARLLRTINDAIAARDN